MVWVWSFLINSEMAVKRVRVHGMIIESGFRVRDRVEIRSRMCSCSKLRAPVLETSKSDPIGRSGRSLGRKCVQNRGSLGLLFLNGSVFIHNFGLFALQ